VLLAAAPEISVLAAAAATFLSTVVAVYFRNFTRATTERIEVLSERVSLLGVARRGALVCDYVDVGTLATLATQYRVQPRPDEVERSSAAKTDLRGEIVTGPRLLVHRV
jgi:hypothetical protein